MKHSVFNYHFLPCSVHFDFCFSSSLYLSQKHSGENYIKGKLAEAVGNKGRLTDEEVVRISQQLDTYIVETQSRQDGERRKR